MFFNYNNPSILSFQERDTFDAKKTPTFPSSKERCLYKELSLSRERDSYRELSLSRERDVTENSVSPENATVTENSVSPENATVTENSVPPENATVTENSVPPENATVTENSVPPENATVTENSVPPKNPTLTEDTLLTESTDLIKRTPPLEIAKTADSIPFEIRQSSHNIVVLKLLEPMAPGFFTKLGETIARSAVDLKGTPIILDLDDLSSAMIGFTFTGFVGRLRHLHLTVIGVQGGNAHQRQWAQDAGLAVFPSTSLESLPAPALAEKKETLEILYSPTDLIEERIIRSGRQLYARNSSLVLIASVRSGGEVMADGDIHIYGRLEGRALAGCHGNKNARIFCQVMAAEMVSIAGHYVTHDNLDGQYALYKGRPTCIFLKENALGMTLLEY